MLANVNQFIQTLSQIFHVGGVDLAALVGTLGVLIQIVATILEQISHAPQLWKVENCSNNLNQVAKRANESGKIYSADLADLRTRLDELIDIGKQILSKLAEL